MGDDWLAGFDVEALLGCGPHGEVWRVRRRSDGRVAAAKRVTGVAVEVDRLRRAAAVLAAAVPEHAPALHGVTAAATGEPVVVTDLAGGGSLAALLAGGSLSAGELVTVLGPLAAALASLHAADLAHGHVGAGNVLLSADGRPLLADAGLVDGAPADDVVALARLGLDALGRPAGPDAVALADLLLAAVAAPPPASDLAAAVLACCPARPVGTPGSAGEATPQAADARTVRRPRRVIRGVAGRRLARRGLPAALATAAVAAAVLLGSAWGRHDADAAAPGRPAAVPTTTAPAPPAADGGAARSAAGARPLPAWRPVVARLERRRAEAFVAGDVAALRRLYVPGSGTGRADVAALRRIVAAGCRLPGLTADVLSARPEIRLPDRVTLRVVDRLSAYAVRLPGGRVSRHPARPARPVAMTLVRAAGGWRIASVRPLPAG